MKIQFLNGGLANQTFQYIFARFCELHNPGEKVWLDDSFFFVTKEHNGYELEKAFGIKANLLSEYFTPDVWEYLIQQKKNGVSICQSIRDMGEDIVMIAESITWKDINPFNGYVRMIDCNQFTPQITEERGNIYYHGYWINKNWLYTYKDELFAELRFPPITDKKNLAYAKQILDSNSLSVHVRRGDFVSYGIQMAEEEYLHCSESASAAYPDAVLFVFSDDIPWCREHEKELGFDKFRGAVYVEGNAGEKSYIDMQLMSMCRGVILSNSAFCYLAALLNTDKRYYINPISNLREL